MAKDISVGAPGDKNPSHYSDSLALRLQAIQGDKLITVRALILGWAKSENIKLDGEIPIPVVKTPTAADVQSSRKLPHVIRFSIKIQGISKVRILIVSPGAKSSAGVSMVGSDFKVDPAAHSGVRTLRYFLSTYDLNLSPVPDEEAQDAVTCTYVVSASDIGTFPGKDRAERQSAADREYYAVAATYTAHLFAKGVRPGVPFSLDIEEKMKEAGVFISNGFADTSRGAHLSADGTLFLVFEDVGPVRHVRIDVTGDAAKTGEMERAFNKLYILDGGRRTLVTGPRHVLLRDALEADLELLQSSGDNVMVGCEMESEGMHFIVTPKERVKRQIKFSAGVAYSPEKSATAIFSADVSQATAIEDSLKFTFEAGPETLAGNGEIDLPLWDHPDALRLVASAGSEELKKAYFGNVTRGPVESTRTEGKLGLRYEMDFTSHYDRYEARRALRKDRERWGHKMVAEGGLHYTNLSLDGSPSATAGLDDGDAAGLYLTLAHKVEYDARDRAGTQAWQSFLVGSRLDIDSGFADIADSDGYAKVLLQSEARAIFMSRGEIAGYVAAGFTAGWASDDTPTYMAFGAGGSPFVRGLQQDEFIGREYFGGGIEAGLNLHWLLSRSQGKEAKGKPVGAPEKEAPKVDLQQVYLALFADFGSLADRTTDGEFISTSQSLQGYGIQLQVMDAAVWNHGASLAIGYAFSPQSEINESGAIFTKAFFEF